jgi:hypothetical protein
VAPIGPDLALDVERRVQAELGWRVVGWRELGSGTNNRLFRLELAGRAPLLAKFYARDQWDRLGTEYPALALLAGRGQAGVPRPYLRSDDHRYGVYSFEPGQRKAPADLDPADARAAAALAAEQHGFGPDEAAVALGPASPACLSLAEQIDVIGWRLRGLERHLAEPDCPDELRAFARAADPRGTIDRLIAGATADLAPNEIVDALPRSEWRLNSNDYGPHNLLFAEGGLTAVDFEGAGWDDPARMVMGFVAHAGSEGLTVEAAEAFLLEYGRRRRLSAAERARYRRVGRLYDAEWAATYLWAATPAAIEAKRFGVPDFDLSAYVAACLRSARNRLARAERGDAYQFPP